MANNNQKNTTSTGDGNFNYNLKEPENLSGENWETWIKEIYENEDGKPYIKRCGCGGNHGFIILADKTILVPEITQKDQAYDIAEALSFFGQITPKDLQPFYEEINKADYLE